jgi:hypothetical protein
MRDGEERPPWSVLLDTTMQKDMERKRAEYAVALNLALRLKSVDYSYALRNGILIGVVIGFLMTLAVEALLMFLHGKLLLIRYIWS